VLERPRCCRHFSREATVSGVTSSDLRRAGRNQSLFREINDRVAELNERLTQVKLPQLDWLCECADTDCVEQISMTLAEYGDVRANPLQFAVAPGPTHVVPDAENIVVRSERFWVVEKFGEAAEEAGVVDGSRS
jgi:hypothetical protein